MDKIAIAKLCEEVSGKKLNEFQPGDEFAVKGIKIKSYNTSTKTSEFQAIQKIRYQGVHEVYELRDSETNELALRTNGQHKMFDPEIGDYVNVADIEDSIKCITTEGTVKTYKVISTKKVEPMFDVEVEKNHNYFTNGILSKNCTGGEAANFYPSTRFRVTPKEQITKSGEIVGITMKIKNYKNKTGIPFRECLLDVYFKDGPDYHKGIDGEGQYIDMLVELGIVSQHGAWFYYKEGQPDMQKFQGKGGAIDWFKANPEEFAIAKSKVDAVMSGKSALDSNTVEVDEEVEYRKEQMEEKAKRDAAMKDLATEAAAE